MPSDLPQTINPLRLARTDSILKGRFHLSEMERLASQLQDSRGEVNFELQFTRDDEDITQINGSCRTSLIMACQRCFEPIRIEIATSTRLVVVPSIEAAREIPDAAEPLLFSGEAISLKDLVEEEVLLALPIAPLHDNAICHATGAVLEGQGDEKTNPFSVLRNMKT